MTRTMKIENEHASALKPPEMKLSTIIWLVLLHAVLITVFYVLILPFHEIIPPILGFLLLGGLILAPLEIAIIMIYSKKEHNKYGLQSALLYTKRLPLKKFGLYFVSLFAICAVAYGIILSLPPQVAFQAWLEGIIPQNFNLGYFPDQLSLYPKWVLILTAVCVLLLNGFVVPIVEELFFRGFLLPRMQRFGKLAPLWNTVLFSIYHFWTPWENLPRIASVTPFVYAVQKTKNIYLGMFVHCALNIVGSISLLILVFNY